jgi:hypothetical protein
VCSSHASIYATNLAITKILFCDHLDAEQLLMKDQIQNSHWTQDGRQSGRICIRHMRLLFVLLAFTSLHAAPPPFRTDADGPITKVVERDGKPVEWFKLIDGQFPPEGSAHAVSGELIQVDHLERTFQLRVDRNDSQDRGHWDLPLGAVMLPYGSIWLHGAPAALQDIPHGTHLHGLFYTRDAEDKAAPPPTWYSRKTPEIDFRRCFRLEDEFTFHSRQKQTWKVSKVDLTAMKLHASLTTPGQPQGPEKTFDLLSHTQVFQGKQIADLKAIQPGQQVLFNLTWTTLYGPGRITHVWLDETARALATAQQLERHRNHIRERGLPGWITSVDDEAQQVTLTFFGGIDPLLFNEWQDRNKVSSGGLAVSMPSLMTYDPVNDRKSGKILEFKSIPLEPGSSGFQMKLQMDLMLEGYRPKRIIRFYPSSWPVNALPKEEQYFGRE